MGHFEDIINEIKKADEQDRISEIVVEANVHEIKVTIFIKQKP